MKQSRTEYRTTSGILVESPPPIQANQLSQKHPLRRQFTNGPRVFGMNNSFSGVPGYTTELQQNHDRLKQFGIELVNIQPELEYLGAAGVFGDSNRVILPHDDGSTSYETWSAR